MSIVEAHGKSRRAISIAIIDGAQIVLYVIYLSSICVMKHLKIEDRQRLVGHLFFMNTLGLIFFSIYGTIFYITYKGEIRRYYGRILISTSIIAISIVGIFIILTALWVKQFESKISNRRYDVFNTKDDKYLVYGNDVTSGKSDTSRVSYLHNDQ